MNRSVILMLVLAAIVSGVVSQAEASDASPNSIREVLRSYSQSSGEKVIVDPRVKGRVALLGQSFSDISYDQLTVILGVHNFGTYRAGGYLVVVPSNILKSSPITLVEAGKHYADHEIVRDLIMLEKLCPINLVPIVRPLLPPTSHFAPIVSPRSILITDAYSNTQQVRKIITQLESQLDKVQKCPGAT